MNLFLLRRAPEAIDAILQPGRPANYGCGINVVHPFLSAAPHFQKHHDLSPLVPVTGVAGMSIDGKRNPIAVTSFGCNDPNASPSGFNDHMDWSRCQPTRHEGFTITYPATWFLLPQQGSEAGETTLFAQLGGNTCAVSFSVRLRSGSAEELQKHEQETLARLRTLGNDLTPDPQPLRFGPGSEGVSGAMANQGIVGAFRSVLFSDPDGGRLAQVTLFGCVSRSHPDREARLAGMGPAFHSILESMRFT
jgi:hypothetical protein